jgi:tRNA A37 threonylcarbamoyladenosine dehydratase
LRASCPFRCKKPTGYQTEDQNRTSPQHIIIKTTSTENRERIIKAVRQKTQITYKGKLIKITADFSTETLKTRKAWSEILQTLKENNFTLGYSTQQNYHSKLMEE